MQGVMPRGENFKQTLCADNSGFSLNAVVRCVAEVRQALEQPGHYITGLELTDERAQANAAGHVVSNLKSPGATGHYASASGAIGIPPTAVRVGPTAAFVGFWVGFPS